MKRIIQRVAALVIGLGLGFAALAGLETVTHISDLNSSWPLGSDLASTSDDHIRNIKVALKTDFPNVNAAVTGTPTQLNNLTSNISFTGTVPSASGFIVTGSTVPANGIYLSAANTLGFATASTARGSINGSGAWSIPSPTSGTPLTITAQAGGVGLSTVGTTTGASNQSYLSFLDSASTRKGYIGDAATGDSNIIIEADAGSIVLLPSAGLSSIQGTTTGAANVSYLSFLDSGGTRKAYIGDASGSSSDLVAESDAGNISFIPLASTGVVQASTDGGATFVDMTPAKGTFTITYTGMTAGVTGTASWVRMGNIVVLTFPLATGTSNATTFTATGLPAAIQPASLTQQVPVANCENVGTVGAVCQAQINSASGTINMLLAGASGGWTNSGVKGIAAASSVTYSML